jgi:flagellar assembly protein FliH
MILKGPDVRARSFVVPHSLPGELLTRRAPNGAGGANGAAAEDAGPMPEDLLARAQATLDAAVADAERIRAEATEQAANARAEAARLQDEAAQERDEAARLEAKARAEAERLLAQAQVELGRARAEAERLLAQAQARLDEAGEIIPTAAEARALLEEHTATAERLVAEAEARREAIFAAAREQGLEEGRAAGREEGARLAREEVLHDLELAHTIAANAKVERETLIADAEPHIVRLALDVAAKLIAREVEADADILKGLVTRALLKAAGDEPARLRLNPIAIDRLGDYLQVVTQRFAGRGVEVVPDATVEVAGAIVETRSGAVDARLSTQLAKVERTLLALAGE